MEGTQMKDLFRNLSERIQSASLSDRKMLFCQLDGVTKLELSEAVVREFFSVLKLTLSRYCDNRSRFLVENFITQLIQCQPKSKIYFIKMISDLASQYANIHASSNIARTCLTVLSWSSLKPDIFKEEQCSDDIGMLIKAQATLLLSINNARCNVLDRKAYKKLCTVWQSDKDLVKIYAEILQKQEPSLAGLVLWFHLFKYLLDSKETVLPQQMKVPALDLFGKIILSSKTKLSPSVLKSGRSLLQFVTHDEFQSMFLPALRKALLRNPEVILETVGEVILGVPLDLSEYALELGKSIGTHLYSKVDESRDEAVRACKYLAQQCSNPDVLISVVQHFFEVLNGSEGKLTVVTQRQGLLSGIGNISYHAVSGSSSLQSLNEFATSNFIAVLKQEIHEGTVVHAVTMMSLWCKKFTEKVPDTLMDWFQTAIGQKNVTPLIRASYLKCMCSAFHGNTLIQALDIVTVLTKALERAMTQSTQANVVCEGLIASCLILRLYTCDVQAESKLKSQIVILQDVEKLPFLSEKFLTTASEDALFYVPDLLERLLLDHYVSLVNRMYPMNTAMLFCLMHSSREIRQHAKTITRKLISVLGGSEFGKMLLQEFPAYSSHIKISPRNDNNNKDNAEEQTTGVSSGVFVECLTTLCSGYNLDETDIITLGVESLFPAHLPVIAARMPNMWEHLLQKLKVQPETFAKDQKELILQKTIYGETIDSTMKNCMKSLVGIAPNVYVPLVVDQICDILKNPAFCQVTMEEYAIYRTTEGELYDTSVIENLKEDAVDTKNIKRESKLYSYKDQMEEIELRKELEAKKKSRGNKKTHELTKKQQEAMVAQLGKEAEIRTKLTNLDLEFKKGTSLLLSAAEGNREGLRPFMSHLLQHLIPLIQSPLCAEDVAKTYLELRHCVLEKDMAILGHSIAFIVLRILKPACHLDSEWLQEDIKLATNRVIDSLYQKTCIPLEDNYDEKASFAATKCRLSEPTFSYFYPLINYLLLNAKINDSLRIKCLQLISAHASINFHEGLNAETEEVSDISIQRLPYKQILNTLIQVIENSSSRVQQLASKALLDVAISISGFLDNARATSNEIQVLLSGLQSSNSDVRNSSLQSLLPLVLILPQPDSEFGLLVLRRLWVAQFDKDEENRNLAVTLWKEAKFSLRKNICSALLLDITHPEEVVRKAGAEALTSALEEFPQFVPSIIKQMLSLYQEKLQLPPPILDNFGRLILESPPDNWEPRGGIAFALGKLAKFINSDDVSNLISFFVPNALGDRHPMVRKLMLDAAKAIIDEHGANSVNSLLPIFEDFLDQAPDSSSYDAVRQSVVILMGTLARHLEKNDSKVKPIVAKLITTLSTPSEQVQDAVANCLHPLVPAIKEDAPALVQKLLVLLLDSENYGERRGAAYGLAGLVKGLGILSLKQLEIMNTLTEAIQDKKNYRHREGSLFALEMLCTMLGRLFEPYVVHVLPHLLLCFGDGNQFVREATDNTAKAVMSKLSAHGVKLVLPSLLAALEEDSWRTKAGSVELLGAMAFCAPKQLSSCLPSIVPKLIEVLSDSHMKVQKAGAQALKQIGSVIRNPEIQAIVPELFDALQDPSKKTSSCLSTLLNTRFIHFIDAPSLALIMPVVQRSFQDRSTWTRKMAAQIIGNMYSLTDQKDLSPYLPTIIPGLKQSLLDPVPEVRSVSARALGALVKGMGDTSYEELLPWLMQTLTSESSPVDRSGAAQGLSEVMGSLGIEYLHKRMPEIIATAERTDIAPHVKDGYIMMFIYLPGVFTKEFTPYIGQIITPILKALADENEYVRDTALKAGQRIVNMYAETAIMLLLPELERGLFDENWRIRYSSVQLLGDLLYKISGVSGKMSTETADEDDNFGTETSHKAILFALGGDRRNRVLAGLYMGRSDVALLVRQAALHVWKVVVTNTPRTLREILPTLFSLLLGCLASNSYDKRQVAARTLGDLVRKLGERVLPEIIPILEKGLNSERADQRQGVCIGLSEIMTSTSKEMVLTFVDSLVPTVKRALTDPLREVRQAAAKTFDSLHSTVGVRALDEIIPPLLQQLSNPDLAEFTLDGLRQVMAIKSKVVLPYLVPQLTSPPVNTKALALLSTVAGDSLTKHLNKILPALLLALSSAINTPSENQELEYCQAVVLSVSDEHGVRMIIDTLLESSRQEVAKDRHASVALLCAYCSHTKADISTYVAQLLRGLIHLFTDTNQEILLLSWETLNAVIKSLDATEQLQHVIDIRQAVRFAVSDLKGQALLPGFCLPKGITPILPVFRDAILNGSPELKEQAAQGLGEVIKLTSAEALKPSVVHITGPLIRILGDRFSWNVKVAILETLALLLEKVGVMLKPFLPQLQTTFLKALGDGHRLVRLRAATALSHLIIIHTRCDPLFTELHNAVRNTEDSSVRETMLHALRCVVTPAGDKMSDSIRKSVTATLTSMLGSADDSCRVIAAGCLGALCKWLPEDELIAVTKEYLLDDDLSRDWMLRHGKSIALMIALKEAPSLLVQEECIDKLTNKLIKYLGQDRMPITLSAVKSTGYFISHLLKEGKTCPQNLLTVFARSMNHSLNEVKQVVALTCNYLGKCVPNALPGPMLKAIVPMLVNGTKEKNTVVKANSEYALVTILHLRSADETQQSCLMLLDVGARDALQDVINKVLRKVAAQPEPKEEELDDTLLT